MRNLSKQALSVVVLVCVASCLCAQTASQVIQEAVRKSTDGQQSMASIIKDVEQAATTATASDKRSLYTFLGSLTEQLGSYEDAAAWYAKAAGIASAPAPGTSGLTTEQLVLAAVRCSLSCGDNQQADDYLASLGNATQEETLAYVRLYKVWSWLCRIQSSQELLEPVAVLESYSAWESMKQVRPPVYLTLWYLTGRDEWNRKLQKEYPKSAEAALAAGKAAVLPSPFWFFLPRDEAAVNGVAGGKAGATTAASGGNSAGTSRSSGGAESHVVVKQQVGFFRNRENAENLAARLKEKGFKPDVSQERRQSGTTYFVVTVPEDKDNSVGLKLKTAGFECYPVFADE